jgi:hypothetical protein
MGDEDRFLSNRMETTIFEENPNTFQKFLENSLKARLF